ncbi:MAG: DUF6334 family protein [Candidatus Sulfotelmatobacter sp.]
MESAKIKTAEALAPVLSVFHSLGGQSLRGVRQFYTEGSLEQLILEFEQQIHLTIVADENDDSIDIAVSERNNPRNSGIDASYMSPWKDFIGKPFGWGWVTVNQQGYCDGLLLSFGSIIPQVVLNVRASSIKVGTLTL